jgi:4-hydroxy-2-oxoheptanedioate aldolase
MWSVISGSFGAELLAGAGVDYVCVDRQHGLIGFDSMVPMLQAIGAAGVTPITRVPSGDPYAIMKSLDAGAWGIIVPMVNSAEEAARAVAACRYPPEGNRSWGPTRASAVMGSNEPEFLAEIGRAHV